MFNIHFSPFDQFLLTTNISLTFCFMQNEIFYSPVMNMIIINNSICFLTFIYHCIFCKTFCSTFSESAMYIAVFAFGILIFTFYDLLLIFDIHISHFTFGFWFSHFRFGASNVCRQCSVSPVWKTFHFLMGNIGLNFYFFAICKPLQMDLLWKSKTFDFSISFTFTFYTSGVSKNWRQYSVSSVEDISLGVQLAGNDPEAGSWNESRPILL